MIRTTLTAVAVLTCLASCQPQGREKKVRDDRAKVEAAGVWIYNDLPKAFAEAKETRKPIVVVLRCIPCEECVKLDDDLVDQDPAIRPLLEKFVRVRVVSANGLDLATFQFDTDQSFAVFFLNADGTIYGRFGTRSHRTNWVGDVSLKGLAKALQGALDLHAAYPGNKATLAGKRGPEPEAPTPEMLPTLKGKYGPTLDYAGKVVPSCIHCHQVGDARQSAAHAKPEPMPDKVLFPYPHPKSQGLILDPNEPATVKGVEPGTSAEKAGFKSGDAILSLDGQPLLSIADVQWVLQQQSGNGSELAAKVLRDGKPVDLTWKLTPGWRQADDLSWRSTSWGLRRMATGGMLLDDSPADGGMALRVKHVGQLGPHAAAKEAGFRVGDVVVGYDGKTDLKRETDLLAYGVTARRPGDKVPVVVQRDGNRVTLTLPIQE